MRFRTIFFAIMTTLAAQADEWPHWMGPFRDNSWRESGLLDRFPSGGPKVLWRQKIGSGYSGPAVVGNHVFVTDLVSKDNVKVDNFGRGSVEGIERVLCLSESDGSIKWKHEYPVKYTISYPSGPRCTPVVHEGKVYTLGAEGNLFCFAADTGEIIWSRDLKAEYKTKTALWGYASHPLVDGNKLICLVGGPGTHVCAFDTKTGKEIWRALTSPEQGYSPPTIIEAAGVRQLILLRPDAVTAVNPESGQELWSNPYDATNGSIIMSPVKHENYLFVGGYSGKNLMLELLPDKPGAKQLWRNKAGHGLSPVNVQPMLDNGIMYGFDQSGRFYAVEIPTGKRLWDSNKIIGKRPAGSETAFIVKQGDRYWIFNELGELIIARLSRDGYQEIDRAPIIKPTNLCFGRDVVWCMPAFAHKKMFVRNDEEMICVDLSK
jgi:outer membrane protein assembly factor BamB